MQRLPWLALLLVPLAARADGNPLMDRWIRAVGGAEAVGRIQAVHRVETLDEDGMSGTRESWATNALQRREQVTHAHDQTLIVFDGQRGWRRDWNGFVEALAGDDLRHQAEVALLHSFAALDGEAGRPVQVDDHTLELHAKNGSRIRFVFDPKTGLPLRAEMPSFDGTLTVAFADWRPVQGVKIPFQETWTTGPNKTVVQLRAIDFLPRGRIDLTPPAAGPDDVRFLHGAKSVTVPVNFDNRHLMIPTFVNGTGPIWFMIDSGADYTVLNQSRLAQFHLTPYGGLKTIGGGSESTGGAYVQHVNYRFANAELRDQHAGVLPLRGLEEVYGMPLGGILGFDFLSRFVVDVDYGAKTVTLRPRTWDLRREKGTRIPLLMQGQQPYITGAIRVRGETIPAKFILDLGAADTITFTTPFVAAHHLLERAGDQTRSKHTFAAPDIAAFNPTNVRGLIDAVTLGDVTFPHVLVNLSAAKAGAYTSPAFDGNVCETLLSRFSHVIVDYARNVMIVRTRPSTTRPFQERSSFGMSVIARGDDLHHFVVTSVKEGSPAAASGFQKGDVIAAVDGVSAEKLNLAAVRATLSKANSRHRFRVLRNKRELTLEAVIRLERLSGLH